MTRIQKLVLVAYSVLLCLSYSASINAQTVNPQTGTIDYTTGNLINYTSSPTATTSTWNNGVYVDSLQCWAWGNPGNCGPNPSVRPDGNINFSYGLTDLNQVVNINTALANTGTGISVSGFNFGFTAKNGNGWDDGRQDYLAAYVKFYNAAGGTAASYDYSQYTNQKYNWTNFQFNETFTSPIVASTLSTAQVGFIGKDNNFWAGTYGPEIYNVSFRLKYSVDPCALNPAYSPTCAGFNTVLTSNNLVPNPGGYAYGGDSINNSYAINTALASAGSGAMVHGFQWGYVANANGPYCAFWFIGCFDFRDPSVRTNVNITNSAGASLYNVTREYKNSYNTTEYSYLFPQSQQLTTLGNFNFTASTNDQAYIGSMWSKALYTVDPCVNNPLYSPDCKDFSKALASSLNTGTTTTSTDPALTTTSTGTTVAVGGTTVSSPTGTTTTSTTDPVANTTTTTSTNPTTGASTTTTTTAVATATPSANNPQPKVGEVTTPGSAPKSTISTSQVLSMISSNNAKEANLAMSVATSAMSQAAATANAAVSQAESVASSLTTQSISSSMQSSGGQSTTIGSSGPALSGTGLSLSSAPQTSVVNIGGIRPSETYASFKPSELSFGASSSILSTSSYSLKREQETRTVTEIETVKQEGIKLTGFNPLLNNGPVGPTQETATTQQSTTVKKNVQDNSAAGGVSLTAMATQPVGFNTYSGVIPDAAFYAPKEIYKNQKTVDNARAQRLLNGASDRVYQQMLDQQYQIGR